MLSASTSMLPSLNPTSSKLKMGAGYLRVDLPNGAGINVINGES
jgi:hypothetical protein